MRTTLVILAAGIGSRFGGGIKQLEPVGPDREIIIDYSIHDAIKAGFDKLVFIIRKSIQQDFMEMIGERIEKLCAAHGVEVAYAYQEIENVPIEIPEGRNKPWGTGHAILACKGIVNEPFAIINADDYYGKEGFIKAASFLKTGKYGLIGYILKNTLSEYGGVTRGLCKVENGVLTGVDETHNIVKTPDGAESEGRKLDPEAIASMNFWLLPPEFIDELDKGLPEFLATMNNPLKDEYLLPTIVDGLVKQGTQVSVIPTNDSWFGVTYKQDKPIVVECFKKLYAKGEYALDLYSDL